ncbi:MAG: hypothetical protein NZM11_10620 [Anaerolineales bacterium]|nr:hypothetical protein [Anaerolineales bacterium]
MAAPPCARRSEPPDEGTNAFDQELVTEVLGTIRLLRDEGMTLIVVSQHSCAKSPLRWC